MDGTITIIEISLSCRADVPVRGRPRPRPTPWSASSQHGHKLWNYSINLFGKTLGLQVDRNEHSRLGHDCDGGESNKENE